MEMAPPPPCILAVWGSGEMPQHAINKPQPIRTSKQAMGDYSHKSEQRVRTGKPPTAPHRDTQPMALMASSCSVFVASCAMLHPVEEQHEVRMSDGGMRR